MGTSISFPLANCGGVAVPGTCSVEKEAGEQATKVAVKRQVRKKSLASSGIPISQPAASPRDVLSIAVFIAQKRAWIWPLLSLSYHLFCELLKLHLKAVIPVPSSLTLSRPFKMQAALK